MLGIMKLLIRGLQKPEYHPVHKTEKYEERCYKSARWVSTTVKNISHKEGVSEGFRRLFKYISGDNENNVKVEMTAPVTTWVEPGAGPNCESSFTVAFYIPEEHQAHPPKPSNSQVFIEDRPQFSAFVTTFGGFPNDEVWVEKAVELGDAIGDHSKFNDAQYYTAGYDPPFKPFGRTNEVCAAASIAQNTPAPVPAVCSAGKFGSDCQQTCSQNCNSQPCNKQTGDCVAAGCKVGWKHGNRKCQTPCDNGRWGDNCVKTCSAQCKPGAPCNKVNGNCDCNPGFQSPSCVAPCKDGSYGANCQTPCGQCKDSHGFCHHVTGICERGCKPGYTGPNCKTNCPSGKYGLECNSTCGNCRSGNPCDHVSGLCPDRLCNAGFQPSMCQDACRPGGWGENCRQTCSQDCQDPSTCNKQTGHCDCKPGNMPPGCTEKCKVGWYGQDCELSCGHCLDGIGDCNQVSGHCTECKDNRQMPTCQDCIPGKYGSTCNQDCGHCGNDGACHPKTGHCVSSGCGPGWMSAKCDQKCPADSYGPDCAQKCGHCKSGTPCRHDNGVCEQDCEEGYEGVLCERTRQNLVGPLVGAVLGAGVLIAVAIVASVYFMKRRSKFKSISQSREEITALAEMALGVDAEDAPGTTTSGTPATSDVYQNVALHPAAHPQPLLPPSAASNYDRVDMAMKREEVHHYETHSTLHPTVPQPAPHYQQDDAVYQNTAAVLATSPLRPMSNLAALPPPEDNYGNL
ncbi:hypothetical protein ACOMHN_013660 [Nucella lapillus]